MIFAFIILIWGSGFLFRAKIVELGLWRTLSIIFRKSNFLPNSLWFLVDWNEGWLLNRFISLWIVVMATVISQVHSVTIVFRAVVGSYLLNELLGIDHLVDWILNFLLLQSFRARLIQVFCLRTFSQLGSSAVWGSNWFVAEVPTSTSAWFIRFFCLILFHVDGFELMMRYLAGFTSEFAFCWGRTLGSCFSLLFGFYFCQTFLIFHNIMINRIL